jgi:DNA-binding NarL/FixJ family response regulator
MITVLIVDDHPVLRDGLSALIESVGMLPVAQAASGAEAVREVFTHQPDVVLMDLNMPGGSGIEATREITERFTHSRVLVLTMSEDDESLGEAIHAGARGYLLKGASQDEIVRAITTVAAGGILFSAAIADNVLAQISDNRSRKTEGRALPELTRREHEILSLLAGGARNATIANRLGISTKTVANHLSVIFTKLRVPDRSQAIIVARGAGLGDGEIFDSTRGR